MFLIQAQPSPGHRKLLQELGGGSDIFWWQIRQPSQLTLYGKHTSKGSSLFTDVWEREAALILRARFRCSDCLIRGMITIQSNCNIFPDKTECAVRVVKRTKEQKCTPSSVVHFCFSF